LFKDGDNKKIKQQYYEKEKQRMEQKDCTFKPNNQAIGLTKQISVKLFSSKDGRF